MEQYGVSVLVGTRINLYGLPLLLAAAVCVALEVWLARREKRWPGLLLPGAAFLWALAAASAFTGLWQRPAGVLGLALLALLWHGVPALMLLAVYAACRALRRRKLRRVKAQMDKMNIDDL